MKNSIVEIRSILTEQLHRLNAVDCDIEKESLRAEAMQKVATPIINSAKIEADLIIKTQGSYAGTGFITEQKKLN